MSTISSHSGNLVGDENPEVLLVNSPLYNYAKVNVDHEVYSRPLGLVAIASELRKAGIPVAVLDADDERLSVEGTAQVVNELHPKFVGLNTFTPNIMVTKDIVARINSDTKVILGGHHISALPEHTLEDEVFGRAIGVVGEAERKLIALVQGKNLSEIPGIYMRGRDGVMGVKDRPADPDWTIFNLDESKTDYSVVPHNPLIAPDGTHRGYILGSRSCPYPCTFCRGSRDSDWGYPVRYRTPSSIVEEIKFMNEQFGITDVKYEDDLLFATRQRLEEIMRRQMAEGFTADAGFRWRGHGRANIIDHFPDEMLDEMVASGCSKLMFGVERGNDRDMKEVKKGITTAQVRNTVRRLSERGIGTTGYFMLGFQGESIDSMNSTADFAQELHEIAAHEGMKFGISAYVLRPYPGTPIWMKLLSEGRTVDQLLDYSLQTDIGGEGMRGRGSKDYVTMAGIHDVPNEEMLEVLARMRSIGGYSLRAEGQHRTDEVTEIARNGHGKKES